MTHRWPRLDGPAYGGDYNPEQWPEEIWAEDVALMREAGVNLVSVGVFSWARLEPAEGVFDFVWLDRIMALLQENGIRVDLATPTAAPPPWFSRAYPDSLPVTRDGQRLGIGSRQSVCPSSPDYAEASVRIASALAERYGQQENLVLWHVFNEYMAPTGECYCENSVRDFRRWLRARYETLDALNQAWGTSFWSQQYGDWEEIDAPRTAPSAVNPAQRLDFARFSNDAWLACFRRERDAIRRHSPDVPITTNFQDVRCQGLDQWKWARELDVVSNDHYLVAEERDNHIGLALAADLTRGVAGGQPWLLMEHSTSAVNWQRRNIAKRPGEMARNSLAHFARGADGILFFQWRASRFGQEKFHSAMLPHGGTDTRVWREVVELGAALEALAPVVGSRVVPDVAIVWDWEAWWALELDWRPSQDVRYVAQVTHWYEQLWRSHLTADFVRADADLSRYPVVVVPSLYLTTEEAAKNLRGYVEAGGTLVVSFFSGIVDENDAVLLGGYPGALRDLLGIVVEEFLPLREGEVVRLSDGSRADLWADDIRLRGAEAVASYADGPAAGKPAVTRHAVGAGEAWYVSTRLVAEDLRALLARIPAVRSEFAGLPETVEVVTRRNAEGAGDGDYVTVINHGDAEASVPVGGYELLTGVEVEALVVPAGQVRVVRQRGASVAPPRAEPTIDFEALRRDLRAAAAQTFADLHTRHPGEICGYALYSDPDGITVCCAANTRQHLAAAQAKYPDDAELCRWSPAEWGYEGIGGPVFAPLSKRLYTYRSAALDHGDFNAGAFRDQVYEACVATLESLEREGFFGGPDRDAVVVFAVSDDERPERDRRWIRRLNPPRLARLYR